MPNMPPYRAAHTDQNVHPTLCVCTRTSRTSPSSNQHFYRSHLFLDYHRPFLHLLVRGGAIVVQLLLHGVSLDVSRVLLEHFGGLDEARI